MKFVLPVVLVVKNPLNAGDARHAGSILPGRSPEKDMVAHPSIHLCLEHPMDREGWKVTVQRVANS